MTRRPSRPTVRLRAATLTRRTALVLAATLAVAAGGAACTAGDRPAPTPGPATPVLGAEQVQPLVDAMTERTPKELPVTRLAAGLTPPTNRWFSGLVFGEQPQPVFGLPLSFGLTDTGFALGLPTVTTTEKTITGGHTPQVGVDLGASASRVSAYDTASVTVEALDADQQVLGTTVLAEGSPFVRFTAAGERTLTPGATFAPADGLDGVWSAEVAGTGYGLVVTGGTVDGGSVRLDDGGSAVWFPVPTDGSLAAMAPLARTEVRATTLGYTLAEDTVTTTIGYGAGGSTAVALLPHQQAGLAEGTACTLGSYPSIYGTLTVCATDRLRWSVPRVTPRAELDLSGLTDADRTELTEQVRSDVATTTEFPPDTYFGGKALYRAAMLYRLAVQLGADDEAARLRTTMVQVLDRWTEPTGCAQRADYCFVYDPQAQGLVGLTASFGSDEFNDHHFHYGYFLFAAGVLAADDPEAAARWAPVLNLLAADIASGAGGGSSSSTNGSFPDLRAFDAYAGHSWASGTSPFADGNNQESSSEAVTAWTGLATWASASDQPDLATQATWLLSAEAASAKAYWTDVDRSQPVYEGFGRQVLSLNWGGKRDYGTWFSAEPAAILGIQLIPMAPVADYLAGDPARIDASVAEATGGTYEQKFGDYLLMYSALAGDDQRTAALATARTLEQRWIDDGNSRSYLLAWLMSRATD